MSIYQELQFRAPRYLAAPFFAVFLLGLVVGANAMAQIPAPGTNATGTNSTGATPSAATDPADAKSANQSAGQIRALVQTLKTPEARDRLIADLELLLEAEKEAAPPPPRRSAGQRIIGTLSDKVRQLSENFVAGAKFLLEAPRIGVWLAAQWDPSRRHIWAQMLWKVLLVLAAGFLAEFLAKGLLARPRRAVEGRAADPVIVRLPFLAARTVLDVVPIAAFAGAAYLVLPLLEPVEGTRLVVIALVQANVIARAVMAAGRAVLVPRASGLRVINLGDETANYLFVWLRRFANVTVYGYFFAEAALLLGLPPAGYGAVMVLLGLVIALLATVLVLQNRRNVAEQLRGGNNGPTKWRGLRGRLADVWHVLAVIYIAAMFCIWALKVENGFAFMFRASLLSVVILVAARVLVAGLDQLAARAFAVSDEARKRYPALEARANRYMPVLHYVIVGLIGFLATFALLEAWGIDSFGWLESDLGQRLAGSLLTIVAIAVTALLLWELSSSVIEHYLSEREAESRAIGARARTLLPLARNALAVLLGAVVVMIILSELGVNIGPLLAGAGVVGLAVGFGAQTLVKDVITGVFILLEDQISVGDVIKAGSHSGVVEGITIRTIRLRDLAGTVHVIPFSEVTTLENLTKDFSRYVFNVGVAYREDTDQVVEVLRQLGAELQADPEFADKILEPLEVLGVDSFDDSAVVIKARITTKPIQQWSVGREFNRRMKKRFDELGIEIPFPHRTLYFGIDKDGDAPPAPLRMTEAIPLAPRVAPGAAPGSGSAAAQLAPAESSSEPPRGGRAGDEDDKEERE